MVASFYQSCQNLYSDQRRLLVLNLTLTRKPLPISQSEASIFDIALPCQTIHIHSKIHVLLLIHYGSPQLSQLPLPTHIGVLPKTNKHMFQLKISVKGQ